MNAFLQWLYDKESGNFGNMIFKINILIMPMLDLNKQKTSDEQY